MNDSTNKGSRRLARILNLIPFLQRHSGISVEDAANLFSISEEQLISDLNLIWLCGLPGYSHLELIDVSYDSGVVSIQNAETLARPMRMTFDEGIALLLAIENISMITPESDAKILAGLRRKISDLLAITIDHPVTEAAGSSLILPEIIRLLETPEKLMDIDYYSATLDDTVTRTIRPVELITMNGFSYLTGFSVEDARYMYLRVDRIRRLAPSSTVTRERMTEIGRSKVGERAQGQKSTKVEVRADASAYWLLQKWHLHSLVPDETGISFSGSIPVYDQRWLVRLAMSAAGALSISAPLEARAAVVAAAERARQKYADPLK